MFETAQDNKIINFNFIAGWFQNGKKVALLLEIPTELYDSLSLRRKLCIGILDAESLKASRYNVGFGFDGFVTEAVVSSGTTHRNYSFTLHPYRREFGENLRIEFCLAKGVDLLDRDSVKKADDTCRNEFSRRFLNRVANAIF